MAEREEHAGLGAVPLASLEAVALDTETTGLHPGTDRIVQIGAVALHGSAIETVDVFERMVDPGMPIPPSSSAIHGITDDDVRSAGSAREALPALTLWIGQRLVIGWSIGFDLAMLKAEHVRCDTPWNPYRSLCVRQLTALLAPGLPDPSLDATARWLGIGIEGRHEAVGDARAAAQIYTALVPRLAEQGIVTLAQAERACLALTAQIEEEARAGWHPVIAESRLRTADPKTFSRIDSFPFRHRVRDIMSTPPAVVDPDMRLADALRLVVGRKISSVFVAFESDGDTGILTERDIVRAIDSLGPGALNKPVGRFAARPLVTVQDSEFIYRANTLLTINRYRHLGVVSANGVLVGAVSARDLLKQRAGEAILFAGEIDRAQAAVDLGRVWANLTRIVGALAAEEVDARDIASVISRELRALTRRAAELAENAMASDGIGPPPVPYALMVLGSGGRGESLLTMDQDNAIAYACGDPDGQEDRWFAELGSRLADILDSAGVSYCKGGVMARNPQWRMNLDRWRTTIDEWIGRSLPEDVLNCDIFFDGVTVHGDAGMGDGLYREALERAAGARSFRFALRAKAADFSSPIGMFGRLRLQQGRLDAKRHGLLPIFSTARILAMENRLEDRSTAARLQAARSRVGADPGAIDDLLEAHRILLDEILAQQLRDIGRGIVHGNSVAPKEMSGVRRLGFRWALERVDRVRGILGMPVLG